MSLFYGHKFMDNDEQKSILDDIPSIFHLAVTTAEKLHTTVKHIIAAMAQMRSSLQQATVTFIGRMLIVFKSHEDL